MRPGSIVTLKENIEWYTFESTGEHSGIYPIIGQNYTISDIEVWNDMVFLSFLEIPDQWDADCFREILPPEAMQKEINELLEINQPITT